MAMIRTLRTMQTILWKAPAEAGRHPRGRRMQARTCWQSRDFSSIKFPWLIALHHTSQQQAVTHGALQKRSKIPFATCTIERGRTRAGHNLLLLLCLCRPQYEIFKFETSTRGCLLLF